MYEVKNPSHPRARYGTEGTEGRGETNASSFVLSTCPAIIISMSPPPTILAPPPCPDCYVLLGCSQYRFVMNLPLEDTIVAWQRRQAAKKAGVKVMCVI